MNFLERPLENVKGVGPKTAELLANASLITCGDLLYFFPRKHEDFSRITLISELQPGKVTIKGRFEGARIKRVRRGMTIVEATLRDDTGAVAVSWFNQPYRLAQIEKTQDFFVSGELVFAARKYQITNPSVETVRSEQGVQTARVLPVYREIKGVKSQLLRKILDEIRPLATMLPETLPHELVQREKLMPHAEAVVAMHYPESIEEVGRAKARLGFEEVFTLIMAAQLNHQAHTKLSAWKIPFNVDDARAFTAALPFQLTDAQRAATWEIVKGLEQNAPMNRLLQGDVGSGKTVVAAMSAFMAVRAGYQVAIMAPTELLAEQLARALVKFLEPHHIQLALLTGSVKKSQKTVLYEQIKNGAAEVVVGTHALIQDKVQFKKLGFVIIDEQHRFGVNQRQALLAKAEKMPHLLAMTATPIPRSLQLTVYGELDISLIRQRPAGRKPIKTQIISPNSRTRMEEAIEQEITEGRQVYVICPLIVGHDSEQKSVEQEMKRLLRSPFAKYRLAALHGKLPAEEKQAIMRDFLAHNYDILVSTTVIEVGVDVPNATVMVIEGADRFGLAQLHQLRGRVGRGEHQSYCFLVPSDSKAPSQRLREMERSHDGFYLAEKDLELRGPGEIYGRMQHGELRLAIANIMDTELLKRAKAAAEWCIQEEVELVQYKRLMQEIERYQRLTTLN